jgi:hypothetical protein
VSEDVGAGEVESSLFVALSWSEGSEVVRTSASASN